MLITKETDPARARKLRGTKRKDYLSSYFFILPEMVYFAVFSFAPIFYMIYLSFTDYKFPGQPTFNGVANYVKAFTDSLYWQSVYNTAVFTAANTVLGVAFAIAIAVFLYRKFWGRRFFKALYYLPAVVSEVVNAILFLWIFDGQFGVINSSLMVMGVREPIMWLQRVPYAMMVIILVATWRGAAWNAPIFLAALNGIPDSIYEAADIDGASGWTKFWSISFPSINNTLVYVVIMTIIAGFQVIAYCDVLTNGAPFNTTLVAMKYIWRQGFEFNEMGYAATLSFILFPFLFATTYFQIRGSDKRGGH